MSEAREIVLTAVENNSQFSSPGDRSAGSYTRTWSWLIWLVVSLVVFVCLPGMMSANYLPKTLWVAVTIAAGLLILPPHKPFQIILTPWGAVWAGYMAWALASLIWAVQPRVGLERWLALLLPTLAYLLARRTRFWESKKFWLIFSGMIGLVALIGILQYFFPSLPFIHSFPGTAVPRSTMGQRNYSSMYLMVTLPFILREYLRDKGWRALLPLAALIFAILYLLLARTRGAWLGVLLGIMYMLIAGGARQIMAHKQKIFSLIIPVLLILLIAFYAGIPVGGERQFKGKDSFTQTVGSLLDPRQRLDFWQPYPGITDPLLGAGFGNFPILLTPHSYIKEEGVKALNWEVHNDYLQVYVDLGIPGLILFCLVVGLLLGLAWRGRGDGLILASGAAVAGLAIMPVTTFTAEKVSTLVWIAGVAAILNSQTWIRPLFTKDISRWLVAVGKYLMVLWFLIFAAVVGYTIRGDLIFFKSRSAIRRVIKAEETLKTPGEMPRWKFENIRQQLPFLRTEACQQLHILAIRVLPAMYFDANLRHIICSRFGEYAMELKDYGDAERFAHQALLLHPNDRISLKRLCRLKLINKDYNQAVKLLSQGIDTFGYSPHQSFFCDRLIEVHEYLQMPEQAEDIRKKMRQNKVLKPQIPFPDNRSTGLPMDINFTWSDCGAAQSYELYLWRNGEETPPSPLESGLSVSEYHPEESLDPDTTYIWRVKAIGKYAEIPGDLWCFRTGRTR